MREGGFERPPLVVSANVAGRRDPFRLGRGRRSPDHTRKKDQSTRIPLHFDNPKNPHPEQQQRNSWERDKKNGHRIKKRGSKRHSRSGESQKGSKSSISRKTGKIFLQGKKSQGKEILANEARTRRESTLFAVCYFTLCGEEIPGTGHGETIRGGFMGGQSVTIWE